MNPVTYYYIVSKKYVNRLTQFKAQEVYHLNAKVLSIDNVIPKVHTTP